MSDGVPFVYFHGLPGGPEEVSLVAALPPGVRAPAVGSDPLESGINDHFGDAKLRLVGFSLGAYRALRFAATFPERVEHIHLIAPAGPLELGDYLGRMAGGPIFRIARDYPALFRILTRLQAIMSRLAPDGFARQVFATAQGKDAQLAADQDFRRGWSKIARQCLANGAVAYRAEISAYVRPWADLLDKVCVPITIWYGSADNWVPPAMVEALIPKLSQVDGVHQLDGASHYTALAEAMHHIVRQTGDHGATS